MIIFINVIFGAWLWVNKVLRLLPWGMAQISTLRPTPKVHNISWYTSGFT